MVNVVITAPRGHMDSLIVKAAYEREDIRITGGVGPVGREYIGSDIGLVSGLGRSIGALVSDNLEDVINECDLVVDYIFRYPESFIACNLTTRLRGDSCEKSKFH